MCGWVCECDLWMSQNGSLHVAIRATANTNRTVECIGNRVYGSRQIAYCIRISGIWNLSFRLDADKTDFIIIGASRQRSKLTCFIPTPILNYSITPAYTVRNLRLVFTCRLLTGRKFVPFQLLSLFFETHSPGHVKSSNRTAPFRHHLKTHPFRLAYPS